jgi:hypothetical protein
MTGFKGTKNGWYVFIILFQAEFVYSLATHFLFGCDDCVSYSILFYPLQAEVDFLGNLHHPNLVRLIGYCVEDDQRLLVYDFMPRGSLDNHLFRSM